MAALPRVLMIDDIYGAGRKERNRDRENFCFRSGILDITGDIQAEKLKSPVAEGIFYSGQVFDGEKIENDLAGIMDVVRQNFLTEQRLSLLLLDLHFKTGILRNGKPVGRDTDRDPRYYFGLEILKAIRNDPNLNDLPVVILSSMERNEIEMVFSGLSAFFCDKSQIDRNHMQELLNEHALIEDDAIIGCSLPLLKCLREARKRAGYGNDNILVVGESGTGKELLANYIYRSSKRTGAYVPLFTQGVPDTLIENLIFGHDKGAFAGASDSKPGAAEQADKGTLFIDEFGDIPPSIQTKLLRLLDPNIREVQRLGAAKPKKLDLQVVMATSWLKVLNKGEEFRDDLLYRIKAEDPIVLPPLRERSEDIPLLVKHFLQKFEDRFAAENRTVPQETMSVLMKHDWPGNIRSLERVIERAVLHYKGLRILLPQHLNIEKTRIPVPPAQLQKPATELTKTLLKPTKESSIELKEILKMVAAFPYERLTPSDLVGSYGEARKAMVRCLAGLLRQALVVTSKPTAENPEGKIYYTPAVHLLLGIKDQEKKKWKSPKCADLVRKIIGASEELKSEFLVDNILRTAYDAATRLRQRK